jgi:hypothetical protein
MLQTILNLLFLELTITILYSIESEFKIKNDKNECRFFFIGGICNESHS